jgi:hypothetical protein
VDKTKATVLAAYERITERAGANPQILSLDKEGATLSSDGAFEAFLDEKGTVVRRAEGRNDLAIIDGYMGRLGQELGRIRLKNPMGTPDRQSNGCAQPQAHDDSQRECAQGYRAGD